MKYYITVAFTNADGASSISTKQHKFNNLEDAKTGFHELCATYRKDTSVVRYQITVRDYEKTDFAFEEIFERGAE